MTRKSLTEYRSDWQTHPVVARAIVHALADDKIMRPGMRIAELHCGEGVWLREIAALHERRGWGAPNITANDIAVHDSTAEWCAERGITLTQGDALQVRGSFDLVLGNPPYSGEVVQDCAHCEGTGHRPRGACPKCTEGKVTRAGCVAHRHVSHALTLAPVVCMLVRVGLMTTSRARVAWNVDECPVGVRYELTPRPPFKLPGQSMKGKTDACEYVAGVWYRTAMYGGRAISVPLPWERYVMR